MAAEVLAIAKDMRDGFDRHLSDAIKLEQQGVIDRAQRLQVEVARDTAQRALEQARGDDQTATDTLSALMHGGPRGVAPTTALFVDVRPIGPVTPFLEAGEADQPQLREAKAASRRRARASISSVRGSSRGSTPSASTIWTARTNW